MMARPVARLELAPAQLEELTKLASGNDRNATAAKALLLRSEGKRQRDVARELRVSPSTITNWTTAYMTYGVNRLHLGRTSGRRALAPEKVDEITRATGSLRKAAERLHVSKSSIDKYRKLRLNAEHSSGSERGPVSSGADQKHRRILRAALKCLDAIARLPSQKNHNRPFFAWIPPEAILGFEPGKPINRELYKQRGVYCPSDVELFMFRIASRASKRSAAIRAIISGIRESVQLDDPILVWRHPDEEEIILLDGALRLAAVAINRRVFPETFKLVPVQVFRGRIDAARAEAIRRRLGTRTRRSGTSHIAAHILDLVSNEMPIMQVAAAVDPADEHRDLLDQLPKLIEQGRRREALQRLTVMLRPPKQEQPSHIVDDDWVPTEAEMSAEQELPDGYLEQLRQLEAEEDDDEDSSS